MALTDKQQRFVEEYLIDLNATQAAIRAGYNPKNARSIASENLTKPNIQEALQKAMRKQSERVQISADRVLEELAGLAFGESSDMNGAQLKTSSKLKALELLGKHLGLWEQREEKQAETIQVAFDTEMEDWTG